MDVTNGGAESDKWNVGWVEHSEAQQEMYASTHRRFRNDDRSTAHVCHGL